MIEDQGHFYVMQVCFSAVMSRSKVTVCEGSRSIIEVKFVFHGTLSLWRNVVSQMHLVFVFQFCENVPFQRVFVVVFFIIS